MTQRDYHSLKEILTKKLGSEDDYKREFGDIPFGLMIRKIAKLDHDAAMSVSSGFISSQSLNHHQIVFVEKVIDFILQNGYIEDISELTKAPLINPEASISCSTKPGRKSLPSWRGR